MVRPHTKRVTRQTGCNAEQLAFEHLRSQGLKPVSRNFRTRRGEIDLIMLDDACLVFVEVRYRTETSFVPAVQTVDTHKQRKLASAAAMFLSKNPRLASRVCRFDVLGIDRDASGHVHIEWMKDAFRPGM